MLDRKNKAQFFHDAGPVRSNCAESLCGIISVLSGVNVQKISTDAFALFEILNLNGFQTHALLSGDHENFFGLKNIYKDASTYLDGASKNKDTSTNAVSYVNDDYRLLNALDHVNVDSNKSQFFYLHLMSAHGMGKRDDQFQQWKPQVNVYSLLKLIDAQDSFVNYYDNGVFKTDYIIEKIYQNLKNKIPNHDILLVVTGDHGEYLGEHALYAHANGLHEPVLNVPLYMFGFKSTFHSRPATQHDIAPTLLRELNINIPSSFDGVALQDKADRDFVYHKQNLLSALVYKNHYKWIQNSANNTILVYDLIKDPGEKTNLYESLSEDLKRMFIKKHLEMQITQLN